MYIGETEEEDTTKNQTKKKLYDNSKIKKTISKLSNENNTNFVTFAYKKFIIGRYTL